MNYPEGLSPVDKQIVYQRIGVGVNHLISNLTSSFAEGLSIEDIQKMIPSSYHVKKSVLANNVFDL